MVKLMYILKQSHYYLFQYALPHLRKTQGNIINMSSLVAKIGQSHAIPYVTTKVNKHLCSAKLKKNLMSSGSFKTHDGMQLLIVFSSFIFQMRC